MKLLSQSVIAVSIALLCVSQSGCQSKDAASVDAVKSSASVSDPLKPSPEQDKLIMSDDGETIKTRDGEVVAKRIVVYEAVKPEAKATVSCPPGQTWQCIQTERRYKIVCRKWDPKIGCLKEEVVSWLECVAYDCR
jgi:hypothetical protein